MRRDDQNFNIRTHKPIEDVVGETSDAKFANIWWELDTIPIWRLTDSIHCLIERYQIACAKTNLTRFIVGDMLKVLSACSFTKEIAHLSKAFA